MFPERAHDCLCPGSRPLWSLRPCSRAGQGEGTAAAPAFHHPFSAWEEADPCRVHGVWWRGWLASARWATGRGLRGGLSRARGSEPDGGACAPVGLWADLTDAEEPAPSRPCAPDGRFAALIPPDPSEHPAASTTPSLRGPTRSAWTLLLPGPFPAHSSSFLHPQGGRQVEGKGRQA